MQLMVNLYQVIVVMFGLVFGCLRVFFSFLYICVFVIRYAFILLCLSVLWFCCAQEKLGLCLWVCFVVAVALRCLVCCLAFSVVLR